MKQNKYDDPLFFEKYAQMDRSQRGLAGAGEWRQFQKMMPDFCGKRVLDLGCGYGWHCRYAAENGARSVLGVDISEKMLQKAKEKNSDDRIAYQLTAMEDLDFPVDSFEVVLSSLAFHYVEDLKSLVKKISRWLVKNGELIFSVEHPVFTAYGSQDWYYDEKGEILHFPVDNYFYEGKRDAIFLDEHIVKYHRTLTTYIHMLVDNGFSLQNLTEPTPSEEMQKIPSMKEEFRRPMMMLILAKKFD